jgi:hypothetical protein
MNKYSEFDGNPRAIINGVEVVILRDSTYQVLIAIATKDELITAGLATEDSFPIPPKRVHYYEDREVRINPWRTIRRVKGGLYELRFERLKPPPLPPTYDHEAAHKDLLTWVNGFMKAIASILSGNSEKEVYGMAVHRASEADQENVMDAFRAVLDAAERVRFIPPIQH